MGFIKSTQPGGQSGHVATQACVTERMGIPIWCHWRRRSFACVAATAAMDATNLRMRRAARTSARTNR